MSSANVPYGDKVVKPAEPAREGFTFAGWYQEAACTTPWNFDRDQVTGDLTLYAKWTERSQGETPGGGTSGSGTSGGGTSGEGTPDAGSYGDGISPGSTAASAGSPNSKTPSSPHTGESDCVVCWFILLFFSAGVWMFLYLYKKNDIECLK